MHTGSDFDTIGPEIKERKTLHKCPNKMLKQQPLRTIPTTVSRENRSQ